MRRRVAPDVVPLLCPNVVGTTGHQRHLIAPYGHRPLGSTFIWFSDDRWLFVFLLVLFIFFFVIVVVWVLRWRAQASDMARVN
jgi:hypothetical protein